MRFSKLHLVYIVMISLLLLTNCTHKTLSPAPTTNNNNPPPTNDSSQSEDTSLCFQRDVLPIFLNSCAMSGCHDAVTQAKGYNLTTYAGIMNKGIFPYHPNSSGLYTECVSNKMPKSPVPKLDSTKLSLIYRWINRGAPDDTDCVSICDTTNFTFAKAIVPILSNNCYSCHASAAAATEGGGIVLDNYNSVLAQAINGKLLGDISHNTGFNGMPLGGLKLSDCKITQVRKWITSGAANN